MSHKSAIVVGAGIAGIIAARTLQHNGVSVVVIDKGRGVGGRMATRRLDNDRFDHGAQFFTVRSEQFRTLVEEWLAIGIAREWCRGFPSCPGDSVDDGHPRYCGCNGMKSIVKFMSQALTVHDQTRVTEISRDHSQWVLRAAPGREWRSDMLLMTPPVPQSLELLSDVHDRLETDVLPALKRINYERCLAAMVRVNNRSPLGPPGALRPPEGPAIWVADNGIKKVNSEPGALTIHAAATFSEQNWDEPPEQVIATMLAALPLDIPHQPAKSHLHRWRYSRPSTPHPEQFLLTDQPGLLAFAGDAFGEGKIEGAVLSGEAAAEALLQAVS